jgi:hypothetical protein
MPRHLSPRAVALTDQILATLHDGPGTTEEVAERVGNVACKCLVNGHVGVRRSGTACTCTRTAGDAGWRQACGFDVYRHLVRLEAANVVAGDRDVTRGSVVWTACFEPAALVEHL